MSGRSCNRKMIDPKFLQAAFADIMQETDRILIVKGMGSFASRHELNGILSEEKYELDKASHEHKKDFIEYEKELKQVAITCAFGLACIKAGTLEW